MLSALHLYTQKKAKPQRYFRAENRDIWGFLCLLGGKTMVVLISFNKLFHFSGSYLH